MTDSTTPTERWNASPRPLLFIRVRLYRGGQAEFLQTLCRDEQAALYDDLADLRAKGKTEDDPEITEVRANLMHLIGFLKDLDSGLLELVGPNTDPR